MKANKVKSRSAAGSKDDNRRKDVDFVKFIRKTINGIDVSIDHGKRLEACAKALHNLKMKIDGMALIGGIPQGANHIVRDCIDATLITIRDALSDKNWGKKS